MEKIPLEGKFWKWKDIKGSLTKGEENKVKKRYKQALLRYLLPPKDYVPAREDFNVDLGDYVRHLKVPVPFFEVMKMEDQRNSLLQVIEDPPPNEASMPKNSQRNFEKPQVTAYQDAAVILQVADRGNQKNQPFFITFLVNGSNLYNCMLDFGATSNVMPKKVME